MLIMYDAFTSANYTLDERRLEMALGGGISCTPDGTTITLDASGLLTVNPNLFYSKSELDAKLSARWRWKGTANTINDLPTSGNEVGDTYTVRDAGEGISNAEYGWDGSKWEFIGPTLDMSGYALTETVKELIKAHADDYISHVTLADRQAWDRATADLGNHIAETSKHVSSDERAAWNAKADESLVSAETTRATSAEQGLRADIATRVLQSTYTTDMAAVNAAIDGKVSAETGKALIATTEITKLADYPAYSAVQAAIAAMMDASEVNAAIAAVIADYYNKTQIDGIVSTINGKIVSVFKYQGVVNYIAELPAKNATGLEVGHVYHVVYEAAVEEGETPRTINSEYVWNGNKWEELGGLNDLSAYYTKAQVDGLISGERTRATGEEKRIEGLITTEASRAKAAEQDNAKAIDDEKTAREAAVASINTALAGKSNVTAVQFLATGTLEAPQAVNLAVDVWYIVKAPFIGTLPTAPADGTIIKVSTLVGGDKRHLVAGEGDTILESNNPCAIGITEDGQSLDTENYVFLYDASAHNWVVL